MTNLEITFLIFAYLCGTIPFGFIICKLIGKKDIRKHGSKSIGATNVARILGKKWAGITVALDGLKGLIPILLAKTYFYDSGDLFFGLVGLLAILGHIFPVWLKLKGGKGISTTIFVLFAIDWKLGLCLCLVWVLFFLLTKVSAIGSLMGILSATLLSSFISSFETMSICTIICIIVVIRHKENIKRLLQKKELGFKKK